MDGRTQHIRVAMLTLRGEALFRESERLNLLMKQAEKDVPRVRQEWETGIKHLLEKAA